MKRQVIAGVVVASAIGILLSASDRHQAWAHCQVPCGIYDDDARIRRMLEDTKTITKAMGQIEMLNDKGDALSLNQATRWITTKEDHATHIIDVVSEYFLTQKVKVVEPGSDGYQDYLKKLADHHRVMAAAMKTKQTVDPANAEALESAIKGLGKHYGMSGAHAHAGHHH